jgi:DNA-binding MarR family transcriptional regulator
MAEPKLLTTHAQVLLCIARDCNVRIREIADCIGTTERTAHRTVCDLVDAGLVSRSKNGRRNCYELRDTAGVTELDDLTDLVGLVQPGRS